MPIRKDTTDADIDAAVKWAGSAKASKEEAAPGAPAVPAEDKPVIAPNVSGFSDPIGDWVRGGAKSILGRHAYGRHLTDEEMNWAQRAGRGINKGLAGDVVGARSIAGEYVSGLNELLAKIPESAPLKRAYRSIKGVSEQPDTSTVEKVGRVAGAAAPFMAMAPMEAAAGEFVEGALLPSFNPTAATISQWARQAKMANIAGAATKVAGGAGVGGLAGAIQSPENPEAGAIPGMIGGAVNPIASGLFRSKFGQWLGGIGLTEALYKGLNWASGNRIPYYPIGVSIVWHSSPFGRKLRVTGNRITDELGRLIGSIPSGLLGTAAGQALGGGQSSDEQ